MFASKASRTSRTSTTLAKEETCLVANGCNWIPGIDLQIQLIRKSGGNFLCNLYISPIFVQMHDMQNGTCPGMVQVLHELLALRLNPEDFSVLPAVKESDEDGGREKMDKSVRQETEDTEPEMLPHHVGSPPPSPKRTLLPSAALEFDLKGSKTGMSPKSPSWMAWAESLGLLGNTTTGSRKSISSRSGQWAEMDPYTYACGSPTIRNRQNFLSLEQLFSLCKELSIMPEVISRQAVVRIFKRAQCAGSTTAHAGSNFGYLTQEAFVDAMGRIGIQAYSEAPYCDEYPEAHEKIHAFLLDRLPGQVRAMRDSFMYGCSGRGKTVQPGYMAK